MASPHQRQLPLDRRAPQELTRRRSVELTVQIEGGADQRQVREGLREVAELLARRPDLLRVQADVVRVGEHLLERQSRLVEPPGASERLYPPERAQSGQPVIDTGYRLRVSSCER